MLPESSILVHPLSLSIGHNFRYSTFVCVPLSSFLNIQTESNKEDDMYYRTSKAWSPTLSTQVDPLVHGLETHSSSSISQFAPVNPGLQLHLYPWATSTHVASLLHGLDAQLKIAVMWSDVSELDKLHICSKIDYGYSLEISKIINISLQCNRSIFHSTRHNAEIIESQFYQQSIVVCKRSCHSPIHWLGNVAPWP